MTKETILITGVTGYIGFKVLRIALAQGYRVRGVVRKEEQISKIKSHPLMDGLIGGVEFVVIPDMGKAGAFDPVLDGISAIIHTDDYIRDIVQPPLDMESSLLKSALNTPSVRRVVITSSVVTLIPLSWLASSDVDTVFTSRDLNTDTAPPYHNAMEAYWASKTLARKHVHEFLSQKKPHFDIIQLLPSVVLGPDDWATDLETLFVGTRAMIMPIVQGKVMEAPVVGVPVLVDDVALAHVDAIKPSVPGNKDYILSSNTPDGIEWNSILDIAQQHFPGEVASGLLQCTGSLPTRRWKLDTSDTEKAFGWKCTSFEDTMRKLLQQYITLIKESGASL
ncbi:hypothetical protein TRIATDRAFT_310002 [Trichoderma atroviride IMI 206040]|uniref:NAD-dependent epimerase/dehydratase domain-containing protein n=1 Tax=Hypocrea atroviridis (strain ATCC 20476 / IMI 206040) TaxID=452589 RepID=G9P0U5_HYPAI|nr:uncharacterized protein TRIATDRAFT_310002 [Trichoderma atroviride IMI 206040]EHK42412.1 hypothetical protein TRIATDRAFT_310002 [Trichoderma atroviride IMI 206040]